jgi:hypothetical protein
MNAPGLGLIGDIGATNARFALVEPEGTTTAARVSGYRRGDRQHGLIRLLEGRFLFQICADRLGQRRIVI